MTLMSYNKFANTNKYPGVRIYISENNDMIFYVRLDGKDIKVGSKSEVFHFIKNLGQFASGCTILDLTFIVF